MKAEAKRIYAGTALAFIAAGALLVTVILPAEYGWDPLGTGQALGLLGLSEEASPALQMEQEPWRNDTIEFELGPFQSVEYKYRLYRGQALLFIWRADGELVVDMHSEPDGAAPGYAESFRQSRGIGSQGSFKAPFDGIHGWFFQNRGSDTVRVTLDTRGYSPYAIEFSEGREIRRELQP